MRFFISNYSATGEGNTFVVYITNEQYSERTEFLAALREAFGPWMFLGMREYSESQFLEQFSDYLPNKVLTAIQTKPAAFMYKAELHLNYN
jgi:hypothetical protein